eukprot:GHVS01033517.1.p1 GENE.GHVS01033517.1~~GHVS01033517.1.p1  ORF type:complete len:135 (+),score=28.05 GHVS01033517.1:36-440(+)
MGGVHVMGVMHAGRTSEGTLWDQERREDVVRVVVEEAKANTLLRLLFAYTKRFVVVQIEDGGEASGDHDGGNGGAGDVVTMTEANDVVDHAIENAAKMMLISFDQMKNRIKIFEESLGILLYNGLSKTHTTTLY